MRVQLYDEGSDGIVSMSVGEACELWRWLDDFTRHRRWAE